MSEKHTLSVNVIIDGELREVLLHPCALCGDAPADLDDSGKQVHIKQIYDKYVCEACFMRLTDAFGLLPSSTSQITEISFGEFTVYTTLSPEKAIEQATKWYYGHFDYPLDEPVIQTVGSIIFTSDPRVIVIPEEGEGDE
jgi:hypothetical protein